MRSIYIGNELFASGFRLAGAEVRAPDIDLEAAIKSAIEACDLLILDGSVADNLQPDTLNQLYQRLSPMILVLPESADSEDGDIAKIRQHLGIAPAGAGA